MRVFLRAPLLFPQSFRFRWMVRLALGAGMVLVAGRPSPEILLLVFYMARW